MIVEQSSNSESYEPFRYALNIVAGSRRGVETRPPCIREGCCHPQTNGDTNDTATYFNQAYMISDWTKYFPEVSEGMYQSSTCCLFVRAARRKLSSADTSPLAYGHQPLSLATTTENDVAVDKLLTTLQRSMFKERNLLDQTPFHIALAVIRNGLPCKNSGLERLRRLVEAANLHPVLISRCSWVRRTRSALPLYKWP